MDIKHSFFSGMELGDSESTTLTQYYLVQVCVCTLFFFCSTMCACTFFLGNPQQWLMCGFMGQGYSQEAVVLHANCKTMYETKWLNFMALLCCMANDGVLRTKVFY